MRIPSASVLLCLTCGCTSARPEATEAQIHELIQLDPLLGGGDAQRRWLAGNPLLEWDATNPNREQVLAELCAELERASVARVAATAPAPWIEDALEFLRSDAGAAVTRAEDTTVTLFAQQSDRFPEELARRLGDAAKVGDAATAELRAARRIVEEESGSVSPPLLAQTIGAQSVQPDHADTYRAFLETASGRRWLDARTANWPAVADAHHELSRRVTERKLAHYPIEDQLGDLLLPRDGR